MIKRVSQKNRILKLKIYSNNLCARTSCNQEDARKIYPLSKKYRKLNGTAEFARFINLCEFGIAIHVTNVYLHLTITARGWGPALARKTSYYS